MISGLSLGGIYALVAFAMSLTITTTRILNVAHGVFFVWGGAFFVILSQRLGLHPVASIAILVALFFAFALLFQWFIVRPLLGRSVHLLLVGSILATFGLAQSMESALGYGWVTWVDPYPVFASSLVLFPVSLGGVSLAGSRLVILAFVLLMVTGFHLFLQKTFMGKGARAMAQDSVPFAIWVADRFLDDYPAAIAACISAGGDVDTTCAIVGGLVVLSAPDIPGAWLAAREPLDKLV